jgi:hypothetical protein
METAQTTLLETVITLRDFLDKEQEPAEEIDLVLMTLLDTFITDQQYQLGQKPGLYANPLDRRTILRQILHLTDKVLDAINEFTDGEPLPPAAVGLCRILFELTFKCFITTQAIEAAHPELTDVFAAERNAYNLSRETPLEIGAEIP